MSEWMVGKVGETYVMVRRWTVGRWEVRRAGIVEQMRPRQVIWHGAPGAKLPELVPA